MKNKIVEEKLKLIKFEANVNAGESSTNLYKMQKEVLNKKLFELEADRFFNDGRAYLTEQDLEGSYYLDKFNMKEYYQTNFVGVLKEYVRLSNTMIVCVYMRPDRYTQRYIDLFKKNLKVNTSI